MRTAARRRLHCPCDRCGTSADLPRADDAAGLVPEDPAWNVGFILDGQVVRPDAAVLPGVSMALLRDSGHDHVIAR
ncbi:hypothetical protein ACFY9A_19325 [Streptomyces rubradiris]|uniref:hypothetical protein n=1 Tax=Streptomyces rubradiris TaxID=285531 RepID=UPI0036E6EFD0